MLRQMSANSIHDIRTQVVEVRIFGPNFGLVRVPIGTLDSLDAMPWLSNACAQQVDEPQSSQVSTFWQVC